MQRFSSFSSIEKRKIQGKMWFVFVFFQFFSRFDFSVYPKEEGKSLMEGFSLWRKRRRNPFSSLGIRIKGSWHYYSRSTFFHGSLLFVFAFPQCEPFFPCFLYVWRCNNNNRNWSNYVEAQCESIAIVHHIHHSACIRSFSQRKAKCTCKMVYWERLCTKDLTC